MFPRLDNKKPGLGCGGWLFLFSFVATGLVSYSKWSSQREAIAQSEIEAEKEKLHGELSQRMSDRLLGRADSLFGKPGPTNSDYVAMLESIDAWVRVERTIVAPYLAHRPNTNYPKHFGIDSEQTREAIAFAELWRKHEPGLATLRQVREQAVQHYQQREVYCNEPWFYGYKTFVNQLELELYLLEKQEHLSELLSLGRYDGKGINWFAYKLWYYRMLAEKRGLLARLHLPPKPSISIEQVDAFAARAETIGLSDFLQRWEGRLQSIPPKDFNFNRYDSRENYLPAYPVKEGQPYE